MPAIEEWLASLGLGEYAARFAENDIDFAILADLTDQDLEKIGVASLGHRRKILRAIAALNGATAPVATAASASPVISVPISGHGGVAAALPIGRSRGERRYLTVMFCDLVGSTGIAARLDAEEWRDLVGAYLDAASAAVTEMGGHVAKKLGDGLMALFGYPVAQENDAERAARAALSIQRALAELNRKNAGTGKPELAARIGLETGPVVVDAAGEIYGDAPTSRRGCRRWPSRARFWSRRGCSARSPGCLSPRSAAAHTLKGVPEPMALFRLVRASGGGRRSGARNLTPLVGRDDEMAMLMRRWERARQGDGQLVMIVGEPGLGKSRLIEEFHARLARHAAHLGGMELLAALAEHAAAPDRRMGPPAFRRRRRAGGAAARRARELARAGQARPGGERPLARAAPRHSAAAGTRAGLGAGGIAAPAIGGADQLGDGRRARCSRWCWRSRICIGPIRPRSTCCAASPSAARWRRCSSWRRPGRSSGRPGACARITARSRWRRSIARQVRDMVAELSARHALPRDVVEDVAARTGGVPLFVEEVTRLLLERGEQGGIQAIPPTLQQSLMARLDRLGPAREVAQIGSVIGRGFSYALLRDVAGMEDAAAASGAGKARRSRHCAGPGLAAGERLSLQARAHPGRGLRKSAQEPPPGLASPRGGDFARPLRRHGAAEPKCWRITSRRRA